MAKGTRVKWNLRAWSQLRHAPGVVADLDARASRIAAAAGPGFTRRQASPGDPSKTKKPPARTRARASVGTASWQARMEQSRDNVLQRALNAGRG